MPNKHTLLNAKRKVPKQPPYRINGEVNPEYVSWYKRYCENPLVKRERNRKQAEKTRKTPGWRKYFTAYYREYYKKNKEVLRIRTITSNIRQSLLKGSGNMEVLYTTIYNNLQKIGWNAHLDPKKTVLNHKVSIKLIYEFSPTLPRECYYDVDNLELVNRGENNSAEKRIITEETLKVASKLEQKYPHWLRGLTQYLMSKRGELI